MDRGANEYSQSGLPSPYPSNFGDNNSEGSPAEHASAAQYPVKQEVSYPPATPTSEYGVYPSSARSGSFPEQQLQRPYPPSSSTPTGGMAQQQPNNPSVPTPSPSYPYGQQPSYNPNTEIPHGYSHPSGGMYAQPRPDWGGYGGHGAPLTPGQPMYAHSPASAPQQRPSQVYSFVPIPGAQQHKRPRRRYEEIERMYKCGWNGCEKAYGTLNHLNAHVTMQSHGPKRTPEEFKEIRKEWKARKKEEENQRKAEEERQRQAAQAAAAQGGGPDAQAADGTPTSTYPATRPTLPPIGPYAGQYPGAPGGVPQGVPEYQGHMYPNYPPAHSPYGQGQQQQGMYNQGGAPQPPSH